MISIELRENNRIIVVNQEGKVPIRVRTGSAMFHSPLDLLCCSIGSCIGRTLQDQCRFQNQSILQFEKIIVTMENFIIHVYITYALDINDEFLTIVTRALDSCEINKLLKNKTNINFIKSSLSKEILINQDKPSNCCGG